MPQPENQSKHSENQSNHWQNQMQEVTDLARRKHAHLASIPGFLPLSHFLTEAFQHDLPEGTPPDRTTAQTVLGLRLCKTDGWTYAPE